MVFWSGLFKLAVEIVTFLLPNQSLFLSTVPLSFRFIESPICKFRFQSSNVSSFIVFLIMFLNFQWHFIYFICDKIWVRFKYFAMEFSFTVLIKLILFEVRFTIFAETPSSTISLNLKDTFIKAFLRSLFVFSSIYSEGLILSDIPLRNFVFL